MCTCATAANSNLIYQRWSPQGRPWPRGHILKSLASRPLVLENWPVLGSRTALFFELLKFCVALEKFFRKRFFCGDRLKNFCEDLFFSFGGGCPKNFCEDLFFWRALALVSLVLGLEHSCPWPRECLSLALVSDFFVSLALCSRLHLCYMQ